MNRTIQTVVCFLLFLTLYGLANAVTNDRCWVFLREPQLSPQQLRVALQQAQATLKSRCLARRAKVRAPDQLADEFDLPLNQAALDSITTHGFQIVVKSKMLRAVSVRGSYDQVKVLEGLSFVDRVTPLPRKMVETFSEKPTSQSNIPTRPLPIKQNPRVTDWTPADYGITYYQLQMLDIPAAHNRGFKGDSVLLGMNDAGYNRICRSYTPNDPNSYNIVFDSLRLIATHDFLNGDSFVTDNGDNGSGSHGTQTLSCIAGFKDSLYIGAAPYVSVTLAKTEQAEGSDFPAEEDYWVAGLEWHENYGADIISSSVSWVAWYPYNTRDGHHAPSSLASTLAASRGVLVVNSAGNHGDGTPGGPYISPPSDADSMICAGSVNSDSSYSYFSSRGPSYDGRIKPDLTALGVGVGVASPAFADSIYHNNGTSFSAPTLAGACAVVLSANRNLTPMQLLHVMKRSANRWSNPDTLYGWGIPDVNVAVDSALALASSSAPGDRTNPPVPEQFIIRAFPNPFNPSIVMYFAPAAGSRAISVYDVMGRIVDKIEVEPNVSRANFVAKDLPSGTYFLRFSTGNATRVSLIR